MRRTPRKLLHPHTSIEVEHIFLQHFRSIFANCSVGIILFISGAELGGPLKVKARSSLYSHQYAPVGNIM